MFVHGTNLRFAGESFCCVSSEALNAVKNSKNTCTERVGIAKSLWPKKRITMGPQSRALRLRLMLVHGTNLSPAGASFCCLGSEAFKCGENKKNTCTQVLCGCVVKNAKVQSTKARDQQSKSFVSQTSWVQEGTNQSSVSKLERESADQGFTAKNHLQSNVLQ